VIVGDKNGAIGGSNKDQTNRREQVLSLLLVDLPGYGFAYSPKSSSVRHDSTAPWQSLIEMYLLGRPRSSLKRILLLIDARHGMKRADFDFLESLQNNLKQGLYQMHTQSRQCKPSNTIPALSTSLDLPPIQIVLTKCDLVSQADLARRVILVRQQLSDCLLRQTSSLPEILVSAQMEGQAGVLELQRELASLCNADTLAEIHQSDHI